jgi:hypothetical protein
MHRYIRVNNLAIALASKDNTMVKARQSNTQNHCISSLMLENIFHLSAILRLLQMC